MGAVGRARRAPAQRGHDRLGLRRRGRLIDRELLVALPWAFWYPAAVGTVLVWLLPPRNGTDALDRRVGMALRGHPIGWELGWLLGCLAAFVLAAVLLTRMFGLVHEFLEILGTPVARIVLLAALPVLLIDRSGRVRVGDVDDMPRLAMRVREPWRWWGLLPVAAALSVILVHRWEALAVVPALGSVLAAATFLLVVIAPEEIFFRGLLQTRLETVLGKPAGVVLSALLFTATYASLGAYLDFFRFETGGAGGGYVASIAGYGVAGLFYGYLWVRYRNIWLNLVVRTGTLTFVTVLALAP